MEKKEFKKTFTRSEVEDYVKKMLASSEVTMCEQKDRILELKREIDELKRERNDRLDKQKMFIQKGDFLLILFYSIFRK